MRTFLLSTQLENLCMHATTSKTEANLKSLVHPVSPTLPCADTRDLGFLLLVKDVVGVEAALVKLVRRILATVFVSKL